MPGRTTVEQAELVCNRSEKLARRTPTDLTNAAIDLSRTADHREATLRHALGLGRARQRRRPHDESAERGAHLLEDVVSFLGHRRGGDAATSARRRGPAPVSEGGHEPC
jgi:hypothetical protein